MKCPKCGAEISDDKTVCEYCRSPITLEMKKEREQLNKEGCPKCGSSNITFNREKQGEYKGKNGTSVIRTTVGVCKDCGYTWNASPQTSSKSNNNMIWWVLGWIFFFPAPVMVLIWRKKNTWDVKTKVIVTVVFWIVFFILGSVGGKDNSTKEEQEVVESEAEGETGFVDIGDQMILFLNS